MNALLLDQGNSRWKLATLTGLERGEVTTGTNDDTESFRRAIGSPGNSFDRVLVSSVASAPVQQRFAEITASATGSRPRLVQSTDRLPGVRAGYHDNAQLGVDRLVAMVAARAAVDGACCVVDAGTAVTVDFVDAAGTHLGGFILPGLRSFRDTLLARTAIPRDARIESGADFGRDTATAVDLGARYAVAGLVALVLERQRERFGALRPTVCVGGGDAERLIGLMPSACFRMDHLVLRGLAVVAANM